MIRGWACALACACLPSLAAAWSPATLELARRAQAELGSRAVIVASPDEPAARALPADARSELREAQQTLFPWVAAKGIVVPFRRHWFDPVRCAIYVPTDTDPDAELWAMAHEIGHCVARLDGWQATLWREPAVTARHRAESWADAFATLAVPASERRRSADLAAARRTHLADDAAYLTGRAIACALALPDSTGISLHRIGRRVEQQLAQPGCLMDAAQLRATQAFLSSLPRAPAAPRN
ncbi:MAG TPA: hypothetical protein VM074_04740 [Solimonas sp.]|nr:hypothetical protein [Solimonas sp.]